MEPFSLSALTLGSIAASWLANVSGSGVAKISKRLHKRLQQGQLPVNGDLQEAVLRAFRASLHVLRSELAERLGKNMDPANRFWLEQFKALIDDGQRVAAFDLHLFVSERQLHEFLAQGQTSDLEPGFHQAILDWAREQITQAEAREGEPELFGELVTKGWKIDRDAAESETVTVFRAFCLEFHEALKTDTRTYRIFVASELKEIHDLIRESRETGGSGASLSFQPAAIRDALNPIVTPLHEDIRRLTALSEKAFDRLAENGGALRLAQREIREVVLANHDLLNAQADSLKTLLSGQDLNTELLLEILKRLAMAPATRTPHETVCHLGPLTSLGDDFQGRTEEFDEIRAQLLTAASGPLVIAQKHNRVIHGTGGIGKTRLAAEIAASLYTTPDGEFDKATGERLGFPFVLFISGASGDALRSEIQSLAGRLNLPEADSDDLRVQEQAVLGWFADPKNAGRWLLIIDNVDDTADAQAALYDRLGDFQRGTVLVTSRLSAWKAGIETRELGVLDEDAAVAMLAAQSSETDRKANHEDFLNLARKLGCLAAALEITASYLAEEGLTPGQLLAAWENELDALIGHQDQATVDYALPLAFVWEKSIALCDPKSKELLKLLSLLSPGDELEISYLERASGKLFPPPEEEPDAKPVRIRKLLNDLARFSLVQLGAETMSLIPVLAEVIARRLLSDEDVSLRRRWVAGFLGILPDDEDYHRWNEWEHLQSHLQHFIASTSDDARIENFTALLKNLAVYYWRRALWSDGEKLIRRALEIDEFSLGKDHPSVGIQVGVLGLLLQATNRLEEAEPLMRRSLKLSEAHLSADHPDVAIRLNNLALLLQETNRLEEAEPLMRRALEIDEASFGKDHPRVATRLNNLALLLKAANRLEEAEPLMRRALEIGEASFGKGHPRVATRLNNLALLLQETNRLEEAEPLMRRALEIDEASFGKDHPKVAIRLNSLACLLQATNRLEEAEPLMRRALEIDEASFGKDHPKVAVDLSILAQWLKATNRLEEAEPLMRRALEIDEASFGKDHPKVAIRLNNLAQWLKAANRLEEAEPLMRRALEIGEASFGKDHPSVAIHLNNLAQLFKATNRLEEAEPLMRRALEIDEASFGKGHPRVARDLNNLAKWLQATDRLEEAEPLMRRALEIFVRSLGAAHPNSQTVAGNYRLLLLESGLGENEAGERIRKILEGE